LGEEPDFSTEPFTSLRCLIDERNDIAHSDRLSYYSYYIDTYEGVSSAYFTAIECAKAIQKHFHGPEGYSYSDFEKVFLPPENVHFQNALNIAKKKSIRLLEEHDFPNELKTLEEYRACPKYKLEDVVSEMFGDNFAELFSKSIDICDYAINVSKYFRDAVNQLSDHHKEATGKKISPLFRTLTKKKMSHYYGVKFGEVLPHVKLKIKRIAFQNHHGYMCMPFDKYLILFIIDTGSIELTDIIKNA